MHAPLPITGSLNNQPRIQLDRLALDTNREIYVVRDDLLPGGTKQRAVIPLLREFIAQGTKRVTYASPFAGFAQVALAYGCQTLGLRCTLYCERDPNQGGVRAHAFTELAQRWGAEIVLVNTLSEGEERATDLAALGEALKIPLGFACREFQHHFQLAITHALHDIQRQAKFLPSRAWLPVGSGTLTRAFHKSAPEAMQLCCVNVHVLEENDLRIQGVRALPRVTYYSADQIFREEARNAPPIPSNLHYDAKLWKVIQEFGRDGDLWWNVAR